MIGLAVYFCFFKEVFMAGLYEVANSAVRTKTLAHILTDADLNITGIHHAGPKSTQIFGNFSYVGRHVSSLDVVRHMMRHHRWDNLEKLLRGKELEIKGTYYGSGDLLLHIVPMMNGESVTGFVFRLDEMQSNAAKQGLQSEKTQDLFIPANVQALFNASQDIFFVKDRNFRFVYVNDAFCKFYKINCQDVLGKTDFDILPRELAERYHHLDKEAIEGKILTIADEVNYWGKTIEYKKFVVRGDNGDPYIAVVARDVTHWRQIISMLESKQREFEFFFNSNLFGAFFMMVDEPVEWNDKVDKERALDYLMKHHKVTRVNREFLRQYRAEEADIIGYRPKDFFGGNEEEARRVWREFLDQGGRLKTLTNEFRKDGTNMIVDGDYVGIYDEYGRFLGHFGVQQDVTEKMQQQQRLENYRRLMEESFRVARMGGWESDLETNTIRWTPNLFRLLELNENFLPTPESVNNLVATDRERLHFKNQIVHAIKTGEKLDTEVRVITGEGKLKWLYVSAVPVMKEGRCIKLFGIVQDIHERKLQALQLRESELRFKSIVDSAPGIIFVTNPKGFVTYISQNIHNLMGFEVEEVQGKQLLDYVKKEDQPMVADLFSRLRTQHIPVEVAPHKVRTKTGGHRWMKTSMTPLLNPDGTLDSVLGIAMDITEIKKTEDALAKASTEARKLAAYYKSIVENQSVYVLKLDENGKILFYNEVFTQDFVAPDTSPNPSIKRYIGVTEGNRLIGLLERLFRGEIPSETLTLEVFSENKKLRKFVQWEFRLVQEHAGEPGVIMGFGYDVSELVRAYEKTKELLRLTEDQNVRLQNFAYIVSHNIRSHWANMQGLMNIMRFTQAPEERETYLELISRAINNLGNTIEDLNQILNIKKEFAQPRVSVSLKDEINLIKDTLIHEIVEAGARVEMFMAHNIKVKVVPAYLNSILLNLFSNALKYRSPERQLVIEVHAFKKDSRVVLRIADNGLGIDLQKAKDKIFGLYKTFHNHPQARGFGLFIVKTQVEAMGGTITVESQPDVGTAFTLELPA
jgi:PAS domain S-box-containing protein